MKEVEKIKQIIISMVAQSSIGVMKISSTILLRKINSIEKELEKEKQIELAEHQFLGFITGSQGYSIEKLISSMGLKKKEWEYLKKEELVNGLRELDISEINSHFTSINEETKKQ